MSDDPTPACIDHLRHGEFEPANPAHAEHLDPCKYCFPEGEVDRSPEELVIAQEYAYVVHRSEATGEINHEGHGSEGTSLAHKLGQEDVTDWEDLDLGGEA